MGLGTGEGVGLWSPGDLDPRVCSSLPPADRTRIRYYVPSCLSRAFPYWVNKGLHSMPGRSRGGLPRDSSSAASAALMSSSVFQTHRVRGTHFRKSYFHLVLKVRGLHLLAFIGLESSVQLILCWQKKFLLKGSKYKKKCHQIDISDDIRMDG